MSDLTSELNLSLAVLDDDTADYLTIALSDSLSTLDGMFNAATGHNHAGSHQGGALEFLDLTVGEDLTVIGQSIFHGAIVAMSNLTVQGVTTLGVTGAGATTLSSLHVTGATTLDGPINSGNLTLSGTLNVGLDLIVGRNASIAGTLTAGAIGGSNVNLTGSLTVGGNANVAGVLSAGRLVAGGWDYGSAASIGGNLVASGLLYQRGSTNYRVWDNADFSYSVPATGNTLVQRDGNGYIQASYISSTADTQPGNTRPTHVLGRLSAGDSYLRWWPANAIGPPAVARFLQATLTLPSLSSGGGTANATVNVVSNSLNAGVAGAIMTIPYTGYYSIAGGFSGSNLTGNSETMQVNLISAQKGIIDQANCQIKVSSFFGGYFSYVGLFNAGDTLKLEFHTQFDSIGGGGELILGMIPTADYPN